MTFGNQRVWRQPGGIKVVWTRVFHFLVRLSDVQFRAWLVSRGDVCQVPRGAMAPRRLAKRAGHASSLVTELVISWHEPARLDVVRRRTIVLPHPELQLLIG